MAHLDDNARTGLHALGLGVLVIGVPVLAVQLIDALQTVPVTTDHRTLHVFRNGYLLPVDGPQFCSATMLRMERVGMAAFAALLMGGGVALLSVPLRRWLSPWAVGRWVTALTLLFFLWSALARPTRSVRLENRSLTITEHPTLFGDLTLPGTSTERVVLSPASTFELEQGTGGRTTLIVRDGTRRIVVGSSSAEEAELTAAVDFLNRMSAGG